MKKFLFFIFIFLNSFFLLLVSVLAVNYPNPTGFVNDYAGIYSSDFKISSTAMTILDNGTTTDVFFAITALRIIVSTSATKSVRAIVPFSCSFYS